MSKYVGEKTSSDAQIIDYLQELTKLGVQVVNDQDFHHTSPSGLKVLSHVSDDYIAEVDGVQGHLSFERVNAIWAEKAKLGPHADTKVTSMWTELDSSRGTANVYAEYATRGWQENEATELKAFGVSSWRLERSGLWVMCRFKGMRIGGPSHLTQSLP